MSVFATSCRVNSAIGESYPLGMHLHGYNVTDTGTGASTVDGIYALTGCSNPLKIGDHWIQQEYPATAPHNLGSMGYDGRASLYISRIRDAAWEREGLNLEFYRGYNVTWHDPAKYLDALNSLNMFSSDMRLSVEPTGDWNGVHVVNETVLGRTGADRMDREAEIDRWEMDGAEQAAQQLRVAAQGGQLEAVRQLLQEDAFCASSADGTDTEGRTALHLAALNRHLEIVQALLAHRAAVTADAEGALGEKRMRMVEADMILEYLESVIQYTMRHHASETPLHHAAFSGRAAIVAELLAARASRTAENANGRTPLDYAQLKGSKEVLALLTAEPLVDEETASQEHPPSLLNILHFAIRQRPAVVEGADEISYHGHIKLGAAICYISFPGKYKAGWDALIAGLHGSSVACVFLCAAQDGLGQHAVDPDDPRGRCYCHRIYGERTYKEFGYLHFVKKKRTDCTDEEIRKIEEKAKAMNGVVVFADATPEETRLKIWKLRSCGSGTSEPPPGVAPGITCGWHA
ncbi:Ankyrin-3 (ANK-3) (Ankyrin-G) [Durusdinium trenchii]|uniref:Ankyrin-3 (ANK-3) (Ankyrin-G) n=1 Tax=Durusdinium trenchii TaxID=1381693 RepID=A0ABP0ICK1_9DINO